MLIEYERHLHFLQNIFCISKHIVKNEVPISCLVVLHNKIIGVGYNKMISSCNPNNHAELVALNHARKTINSYYAFEKAFDNPNINTG